MIYPTARAVVLALLGAPLVLVLGVVRPGLWLVGVAWAVLVLGLCLADAVLGADRRRLQATVRPPASLPVGGSGEAVVELAFSRGAPSQLQLALEVNALIQVEPDRARLKLEAGRSGVRLKLTPLRRGEGVVERLWVRWRGPFGLVFKQVRESLDLPIALTPNIGAVKDEAVRLFSRDASFGVKSQLDTGEGSEFHALRDFQAGMDRRTIDWRHSARHGVLLAKEFRTERNHPVILAIDCGRLMSQPLAGLPRLDRALNAGLLIAYVGLKIGDRVGVFSFDSRPRLSTGAVSGPSAFPLLQRQAARIDYSAEETNFTLGLTTLQGELERRSLIVVFTDFADSTSAELMIENVARLLKRHLVLFVVMRDEELEELVRTDPATSDDVSRAVIAHTLIRERELVAQRLRRLGAQIVEAPADQIGPALLNGYIDLKRKELL